MSVRLKIALTVIALMVTCLLLLIMASNLTLLMSGHHDGQLHLFTIFESITSDNKRVVKAARLALIICSGGIFFIAVLIWQNRNKMPLHGIARFANEHEIKKAGLRSKNGILVGKKNNQYLIFGGQEHVIIYAPTRSGKGVSVVIPNLLNWPGSSIVLDIKHENWTVTAGFRKQAGQDVYLFNPFDPEGKTARYNPLTYVRRDNTDDLYDDLQRIAGMLFPLEARNADPFWTESAKTAFIAIAGFVAETPELPFTIGEVLRQFASSPDISEHFKEILKKRKQDRPLSQSCYTAMNDFLAASENTLQSVRKSATAKLGLWLNARIDAATSDNDFDLRDLRKRPISIYLGVTPNNLDRLAPLLNLFFQQAIDLNTQTLPEHDKNLQHQLLLVMDEFRTLGNVDILSKGISYIAGYGLRVLTIIQSPSQLHDVYGVPATKNYMTNHAVEIVFTPKENDVANELSERFGYLGVSGSSHSRGIGFSRSNQTETTSDQRRALMLPQELTLTPFEEEYIIKAGIPPIKAKKIIYYKDQNFKKRLMPPPEVKPMNHSTDERIKNLECKIEALNQTLVERVSRTPKLEEIVTNDPPADGEDGTIWILPNDLADAFKTIEIDDLNPEKNSTIVTKQISKWLETIAVDRTT